MESPGKFIEDEELREAMKGSGLGDTGYPGRDHRKITL